MGPLSPTISRRNFERSKASCKRLLTPSGARCALRRVGRSDWSRSTSRSIWSVLLATSNMRSPANRRSSSAMPRPTRSTPQLRDTGSFPRRASSLGALAGGASRMLAVLRSLTDTDLERGVLIGRPAGGGEVRVQSIRGLIRVWMRSTEEHFASVRATLASAT